MYCYSFSCKTYTLHGTPTDGTNYITTPTLGNTTATVNAVSTGSCDNSRSGNSVDNDGSKFIGISFFLFLFCFLL